MRTNMRTNMRSTTAGVLMSCLIVGSATGVGAQCVSRVGEWAYGPTYAAAGNGSVAVYGSGRMLVVADVSDPTRPSVLGAVTLGDVLREIVLDGDAAYVAANAAGLVVVDISRPDRPEIIGSHQNADRMTGLALAGGTAYLANQGTGLLVLDVSDPAAPTLVATLDLDLAVDDVAVHGDLAYLANDNDGLRVVDISDRSAPSVIASLADIGRLDEVDVSGDGRLAVVTNRYDGAYRIIDVSEPTAPAELGIIEHYDYALDVALDGHIAYLANRTQGLFVYDLADPSAPVEIARVDHDGQNEGVSIHGAMAYLANHWGGLRLVDISTPGEAEEVGLIGAFADLRHAAMDGGLAVAAAGLQLVTLDVSDPAAPAAIAAVDLPGYVDAVLLDGDLAYVAADYSGLEVVDLSDPADPVVIGTADTCDAYHLARSGQTVYVACGSDGLSIVDVSSPTEPEIVGGLDGFRGDTVAAADGAVYMTDYSTGVSVIDVGDPTAPSLVTVLDIPRPSHPPRVNGDRLFVSTSRDGVVILDITNPLAPLELGRVAPTSYLFGTAPIGNLLFVASIYSGGYLYDVSDPAAAVQLDTVDFAVEREGEVCSEGALVMTTEDDAGLEIFDLTACFDEPPTAGFTWRPVVPDAGRRVQLTDTSFGSIATRSWDFGDGGGSGERYPTHIWAEAGDYEVTLTVSGPRGSRSITRTVTVVPRSGDVPPITEPGDHVYVVAAAAHAPGLAGTQWVTDLVLHNPGTADARAHLWFMKAGQDNTGADGVAVEVAAGTSVAVDDVVASRFGEDDASGALLVGCDRPLRVTSRTYNDAASGTFGQFIPGLDLAEAVTGDDGARLVELTRSDDFRTNLGVANPTESPVQVEVSLRRADGSEITTRSLSVPPFGYLQRTDILGTDVADAFAVVDSKTPGARYFPYASVVDNRTGDPIMVQPIDPDGLQVIAAAAHVGGLEDTDWRTDLEVCNPLATANDVTIRMLVSQQGNGSPATVPATLPAGGCRRFADVLMSAFSHQGTAALEVASATGQIIASSRTFNTTDDGTFGQFLPGIPTADVIPSGRLARVTQLAQGIGDDTGFRTNLGFVSRSPTAITVDVELRTPTGELLGSLVVPLAPFEHRQINRVFRQVSAAAVAGGTATVSTPTPGGAFVAYASVVDNASGDPVYMPAEPLGD